MSPLQSNHTYKPPFSKEQIERLVLAASYFPYRDSTPCRFFRQLRFEKIWQGPEVGTQPDFSPVEYQISTKNPELILKS